MTLCALCASDSESANREQHAHHPDDFCVFFQQCILHVCKQYNSSPAAKVTDRLIILSLIEGVWHKNKGFLFFCPTA